MRVISGSARGLKLKSPEGSETRPTLDRVKEALFSMLLPFINGATVLDLFAGSGALGIEALSRGADKSSFVDFSQKAIECIKSNVSAAKFDAESTVIRSDAIDFLKKSGQQKFDIIFLDPPYESGLYKEIIDLIATNKILSDEGLIVLEWDNDIPFSLENDSDFEVFKDKKYGRVGVTVLKWR